ncbi:transcription-repair coupling factor [soil metagenome]
MDLNYIKNKIFSSASFAKLDIPLKEDLTINGVSGSLFSYTIAKIFERQKKLIVLFSEKDRLLRIKDDLDTIIGISGISVYDPLNVSGEELVSKTLADITGAESYIILSCIGDLSVPVISKETFIDSLVELEKNQNFSFEDLIAKLNRYNYNQKDFVEEVGDYSVRGGIIDFFPENFVSPVRIDFYGDTIDSIREFDITNQRSIKDLNKIKFGINLSVEEEGEIDPDLPLNINADQMLPDYFTGDLVIAYDEESLIKNSDEHTVLVEKLEPYKKVYLNSLNYSGNSSDEIDIRSFSQPEFYSNLKALYDDLSGNIKKGNEVNILCSDAYQAKRIKSLIEDFEDDNFALEDQTKHGSVIHVSSDGSKFSIKDKFNVIPESVQLGFIFDEAKLVVYTEHQIFGRYFKHIRKRKIKFKGLSFSDLKDINLGDYIVHRDFGIGIYSGLKKISVGNSSQEVIKLSYKAGDILFVNMNYVHLIKKFSGSEGASPDITRLGGGEWDKIKQKTKKKVKDIARDLILLYAKRKSDPGFSFKPDTHWQKELEASFMYEDTPDQYRATEEVKADMELSHPMDRLVCGDVGFGKTEVAVRAAFKAVMDNKQVAVLVPTTILAVQHYNTFRDRLSPFAVEVESLTRFKSKKEQKVILEKLVSGKLNIIIGTHRLLSNDVNFKDIGLLIVDEEQKFGVAAKEKIKALRPNIDTLTLTATPIPRTLNFSLLGARDLSIINTPPKNRKPIQTEIIKHSWSKIADIIKYELDRGGQVYFVNDRISNLPDIADHIKEYIPSAKIGIAHGQMEAHELEDVVVKFIEKNLNILVCTKIIESGLDIPNVNSIIINNANRYGLSELYQLRGRVGRSEAQAFSYFIQSANGKMTRNALRRLQAIEDLTALGSGFNLAMRDMEIRGVGNLLGKEQSGFVNQLGFDLFMSIIDEAVEELKETEFKELFKASEKTVNNHPEKENERSKNIFSGIEEKKITLSAIIENDVNALIPKDYVSSDTERLNLYSRLYNFKTKEEVDEFGRELQDRFGEYLEDVDNLMRIIKIKILASALGLEKIIIRGSEMILSFPASKENKIFESPFFNSIISKISADKKGKYNITNNKERLEIEIDLNSTEDRNRLDEAEILLKLDVSN